MYKKVEKRKQQEANYRKKNTKKKTRTLTYVCVQ